jgi:hypothetical protein
MRGKFLPIEAQEKETALITGWAFPKILVTLFVGLLALKGPNEFIFQLVLRIYKKKKNF